MKRIVVCLPLVVLFLACCGKAVIASVSDWSVYLVGTGQGVDSGIGTSVGMLQEAADDYDPAGLLNGLVQERGNAPTGSGKGVAVLPFADGWINDFRHSSTYATTWKLKVYAYGGYTGPMSIQINTNNVSGYDASELGLDLAYPQHFGGYTVSGSFGRTVVHPPQTFVVGGIPNASSDNPQIVYFTFNGAIAPEPSSLVALFFAIGGIGGMTWRSRRRQAWECGS